MGHKRYEYPKTQWIAGLTEKPELNVNIENSLYLDPGLTYQHGAWCTVGTLWRIMKGNGKTRGPNSLPQVQGLQSA